MYDPLREVNKLRDHLSSFDTPIVFLLGAGASASVLANDGDPLIPAVAALTESCRLHISRLGEWAVVVWDGIVGDIEARRSPAQSTSPNIEDVLSAIRNKCEAMSPGDQTLGASLDQLKTLDAEVSRHIAEAANPASFRIPANLPHASLARWIGRAQRANAVEIFTTNYDTLIESALESYRLPTFDGFVGSNEPFFWPPSCTGS